MTQADIERWNRKYEARAGTRTLDTDSLLIDHAILFTGGGYALDVACGMGDNALFLAQQGYTSFGVDASLAGLRHCRRKATTLGLEVLTFVADLESYPLPNACFDVVVAFRYLDRALVPAIQGALKRGGLLALKTFNRNFLSENPTFPAAYCLRHGELRGWFESWRCVDSNDRPDNRDTQTHWLGYKA